MKPALFSCLKTCPAGAVCWTHVLPFTLIGHLGTFHSPSLHQKSVFLSVLSVMVARNKSLDSHGVMP